jgi:hypothetical protein
MKCKDCFYFKSDYCPIKNIKIKGAVVNCLKFLKNKDARPVRKAKSSAQNTIEICHTAPNSRVTQGAVAHIAEAATS